MKSTRNATADPLTPTTVTAREEVETKKRRLFSRLPEVFRLAFAPEKR
jgi:hypothetical protein